MSQQGGIPPEEVPICGGGAINCCHATRRVIVESAAGLFVVLRATLYRALAGQIQPQGL